MKAKFRKGQWLISRWKKEFGGETDFAKFDKWETLRLGCGYTFTASKHYRFDKEGVELLLKTNYGYHNPEYRVGKHSLEWRPATEALWAILMAACLTGLILLYSL